MSKYFPEDDPTVNREMVQLLVYLQDPTLAPRLIAQLDRKIPVVEKLHIAMYARFLRTGWTPELRERLLKFYETAQTMQGGNSFRLYFVNATRDFLKEMPADEQFGVLVAGAKMPRVAMLAAQNLPAQVSAEQLAALVKLDGQLAGDKRPEVRELATAVLLALGRAADEPTLAYLHATFEASPERRADLAAAVAQFALTRKQRPADRELLIQSLPVVEGTTAHDVLRALTRFDSKDAKPDVLRQVILIGMAERANLKDQRPKIAALAGRDAVGLLEHWLGKEIPDTQNVSSPEALTGWQKWYVKTYPDRPKPELPIESREDKYTTKQILDFLDSERGQHADPLRGAAIYEKALCVKCHKYGKRGEGIGPDLTTVSRRFQRKEILKSVLFPSADISDQFASHMVITTDGRSFTGIVSPASGGGVSVMQSDLKRVEVAKKDIDQVVPSKKSAMPERLFNTLTLEEIADLFAYLAKSPE